MVFFWSNPVRNSLRLALFAVPVLLVLWLLLHGLQWRNHWERVQARGSLVVAVRESEGIYWPEDQRYVGLEHDLLEQLADDLNVNVQLFSVTDTADLYRALASGAVDFALPGTTLTDAHQFIAGTPYLNSRVGLVRAMGRRDERPATNRVALLDPFAHDWVLTQLSESNNAELAPQGSESAAELMTRIELGELEMAVMDRRDFLVQRPFFPNQWFSPLNEQPRPISPLFRNQTDHSLIDRVNSAITAMSENGRLNRLQDRHLGHTADFDYVGNVTFERHMRTRLPTFADSFRAQADITGLDWRLLASVAYQESHWRANAVSPTGVRGIMMVTLQTARDMGISNRLDPDQSIEAGSRFLAGIKARLPERITEPDRTWMALAAYNVGPGHLEDARRITETQDGDPDSWIDVRQHLPKLALKAWYPWTEHGYARGHEPVVYVANIRRYYNLMRRAFPQATEHSGGQPLNTLPMPGLPVEPVF